jgi:hypothetical protein
MLKRFIYAGLFAIVCISLILVFLLNRFDKITPLEIVQAVPEDAIVFVEELDYEYLTETFLAGSRIWVDFVNTSGQSELDSLVQVLLAQVNSAGALKDILKKEGFHLSLHLVGKNQLLPLFYLKYPESYSDHEFENLMMSVLEEKAMINSRKYESETLYDVSGEPGLVPGKFTFSCMKGLCLLSSSSMLIEESIRTMNDERDLSEELGLSMVKATAGRYVHANVYINYENLPKLFYPMVGESSWGKLELFSRIASWGEVDLDVKSDALIFNGMTYSDPNSTLFLGAFEDQSPVKMEIHEMLPSGTSYFLHLGISDRSRFREQISGYLLANEMAPAVEAEVLRLEDAYGIDPIGDLAAIMDDELAWFAIEGETEEVDEELLIVETRSRSESMEVLLRWVEQYLQVNAFDMCSMRSVYQLDNQTSFNIYRLPDPFFKGTALGRLFNSYFTLYENYLIFGPSVDVLSRVIYQNVLHKNFVSDPVYKEMSEYLSNRSNITLFLRPFNYLDYKENILSDQTRENLEPLELFLRRIPGVVVQFSTEDRLFYQSISCKYTSQIKEKALTVWESLMDSSAAIKPALLVNHNTSEKEILIQDEAQNLYLINSTGRVLWKLPLEGPVMGRIYQVDFYKNGRLQYLFNTAGKIHLIDRNGNYVERYPISLRSEASNALALFDYDKSRDYRLFIATEDRKVYVYDLEGSLVTGWKFGKTESPVEGEIQHFRIHEKDYIVFSDKNRTYFLDRRGRDRIKVKNQFAFSSQNPPDLDMNEREEKPRWISTDTSGNVMAIYLDGTVSKLMSQKVSGDHFFRMGDFNKDGIPEFLFADGDELKVLLQDGNSLFSYRVKEEISFMPDIYKFSASDVKIGITDRSRNRIYLINSDGSLYEGFPLEGSTRFSIGYFAGSDSRFNLIVGSTNNFLYNYSIE